MCRGSESSARPRGWTRQRCAEDPHTLHRHILRLNFLDGTWPQAPAIADCPQVSMPRYRSSFLLFITLSMLRLMHTSGLIKCPDDLSFVECVLL
uniref:Uncharacterized protein n=1 Tax=Triticum urartu TaxID=4572 RepID=A0A8R7TPV8_TRIUA